MRVVAVLLALASAFFVFYTARLLVVTGWLRHIRPGGQGAYAGAVVFPLLAIALGWSALKLWRRDRPATVT